MTLENNEPEDIISRRGPNAADAVITNPERVTLSERDSLRVFDLLENPPQPNARLMAAAEALPAMH